MVFASAENRDTVSASLLCAACGIADAVGYLHSGVFAANMTGNTVLVGVALSEQHWAAAFERAMTLVAFFGGAMVSRLLLQVAHQRAWVPLFLEGLMLCAAAFMEPKHAASLWLIAAAMGIQAAAIVKFRGAAISTVVVTSTMVRLAESAVDTLTGATRKAGFKGGIPPDLLVLTWVSYGVGAALAVPLMDTGRLSLLLPAGIVFVIALAWLTSKEHA